MAYQLAIFDLDGTLLDTLEDLAVSLNHALACHGLPLRTVDEVRSFVGNGIRMLIERAVPAGSTAADVEQVLQEFRAYYTRHSADQSRPYAGILPMLETLRKRGIAVAVVSNKSEDAVKALCRQYFGDRVDLALGDLPGRPRKPAPDAVLELLQRYQVQPADAVYIGDSEVDVQTARNAGLDGLAVSWGFRSRETLVQAGASRILSEPALLVNAICGETW